MQFLITLEFPSLLACLRLASGTSGFYILSDGLGMFIDAKVAELADALDLGSSGATRGGSSPPFRIHSLPPELLVIADFVSEREDREFPDAMKRSSHEKMVGFRMGQRLSCKIVLNSWEIL